ncbi:poly(A) RNA polymerase, mitochondrial [Platysternon megacephalum]|uniref:Poly(A) RNA polymerase, mitochondrial n=1 Tax=Platysternon megacephalum TaxID=55544 RepID=A0A4D9F2Q2_9SAUR|nr:poly(A) RNA polymerase, mitochondrial [Platysternon megacephalum]
MCQMTQRQTNQHKTLAEKAWAISMNHMFELFLGVPRMKSLTYVACLIIREKSLTMLETGPFLSCRTIPLCHFSMIVIVSIYMHRQHGSQLNHILVKSDICL